MAHYLWLALAGVASFGALALVTGQQRENQSWPVCLASVPLFAIPNVPAGRTQLLRPIIASIAHKQ